MVLEPQFWKLQSRAGITRTIKVHEAQKDPLEPPKFKHKRTPAGPPSPPTTVEHSPPRKLSASDQAAWKIPPCISNWKNPKGYTIPLDKRLAADGRGLQEHSINDRFAQLSESLFSAERNAREAVDLRTSMLKDKRERLEKIREEELRNVAMQAVAERNLQRQELKEEDRSGLAQREKLRNERKYEIERELKLNRNKRPERERDVTEKIALGQAAPSQRDDGRLEQFATHGTTTTSGMVDDEADNEYDTDLFKHKSRQYKADKERIGTELGKMEKTADMKLQFEKHEDDPFGLGSIIQSSSKRRKME
jgi:SNW domain-containing protein 1